jgi:hypothetical protein
MRKLTNVLVSTAGLAVIAMPAVVTSPTEPQCVGGLCDVCPAVAKALTATGAKLYCIA